MKAALLGDIHANLPALETVLAHIQEQDIAKIWNVGDFVGYGAFPDQVVQRLQEEEALSIMGNYDLKVLQFKQKKDKWRKKKRSEKYLAFKWAYENLSKKSRKYLRFLSQDRQRCEKSAYQDCRGYCSHYWFLAWGSSASGKGLRLFITLRCLLFVCVRRRTAVEARDRASMSRLELLVSTQFQGHPRHQPNHDDHDVHCDERCHDLLEVGWVRPDDVRRAPGGAGLARGNRRHQCDEHERKYARNPPGNAGL